MVTATPEPANRDELVSAIFRNQDGRRRTLTRPIIEHVLDTLDKVRPAAAADRDEPFIDTFTRMHPEAMAAARAEVAAAAADRTTGGGADETTASPEMERLLDTRAGLALAHSAWREGWAAALNYCNDDDRGMKPTSPYLAPLVAAAAADRTTGGEADERATHVVDRDGNVWAIVRDGGMVTRATATGVVSAGIAWLERQSGPLLPFDPIAYRRNYPRADW